MKALDKIRESKRLIIERVSSDGGYGELHMPGWTGSVIWSCGCGWEHVSVSPYKHRITPEWDDMCIIKDIFFENSEWAVQFPPAKEEYINNMPNCLHLWRPINEKLPIPPSVLTGVRNGQTRESVLEEIKECSKYDVPGQIEMEEYLQSIT